MSSPTQQDGNIGGETETLYFAYGSNLSLGQLGRRCPSSRFIGRGVLLRHKWQINARGYANIYPSKGDWVEGLCFLLNSEDEGFLDISEGVAQGSYIKEKKEIQLFPGHASLVGRKVREVDVKLKSLATGNRSLESSGETSETMECLVYVSPGPTYPDGMPKREYLGRMGAGIRDAAKLGMKEEYYFKYLAPTMKGRYTLF